MGTGEPDCAAPSLTGVAIQLERVVQHAGPRPYGIAMPFASGVLFLLGFPPFSIAALTWVALVPLLLLRHRMRSGQLLVAGYLMAAVPIAGISYNLAIFHVGFFLVVAVCVPAAFAAAIVGAHAL